MNYINFVKTATVTTITILSTAFFIPWVSNISDSFKYYTIWSVFILTTLLIIYIIEYFTKPKIELLAEEYEYKNFLDKMSQKSLKSIKWFTKTSIFASQDSVNRYESKRDGLKSGRIEEAKYLVNLSYWKNLIESEDSISKRMQLIKTFKSKLECFTKRINDLKQQNVGINQCKILISEYIGNNKLKVGLYESSFFNSKTVVIGVDDNKYKNFPIAIAIKRAPNVYNKYLEYFNHLWRTELNARQSIHGDEIDYDSLLESLESNISWAEDRLPSKPDPILENSDKLENAIEIFRANGGVDLTCPQKVCFAGDYNDLVDNPTITGKTLTSAINVTSSLRLTNLSNTVPPQITINGKNINFADWPLLDEMRLRLRENGLSAKIDMRPSDLRQKGLGSSGAASVLIVAALQIIKGECLNNRHLIKEACAFENEAGMMCGPQDHAASVLGGLRILEFESQTFVGQEEISFENARKYFSFWDTGVDRSAADVIPGVLNKMNEPVWLNKTNAVETMRLSFKHGEFKLLKLDFLREYLVQKEYSMLNYKIISVMSKIKDNGCAAKLSGAGGGGTLVVVTDKESSPRDHEMVTSILTGAGFTKIPITVRSQGLESAP